MAAGSADRSLEETSTWAVAVVCAVFVIISVAIEHGIDSLEKWFKKREKKAMIEALEKIKAELMLLGFISLLLTVGTSYVAKICVPEHLGNKWLPCDKKSYDDPDSDLDPDGDEGKNERRRLLSYAQEMVWRRALAAGTDQYDYCTSKKKVSLISYSGIHQLHIFIFVLAVMHVLYSVILMVLGHAKMKKWKQWELETSSMDYQFTNDPARFRFAHQTSFVRRHSGIYNTPILKWIVAFFRQFFGSISKVDYMTIRNGFITAHFAPNTKFDFHKYIKRSMQDDYKSVLGISIPLWFFAIMFLFLNVYRWHTLAWISVIPLIIILLVGTKLELVIMEMAQQIQDRTTVVRGAPLVEPSNNFFWFNRPQWILFLIHFTLFQYEFGITTCFHEALFVVLIRVFLGLALQIVSSYITFPLYTLVTQMGSNMKKSIFEEQTSKALKKWHQAAKQRNKQRKGIADNSSIMSGDSTPNRSSPIHLLHNYTLRSNAPDGDRDAFPVSPRSYASDTELSEIDASKHATEPKLQSHNIDFSFNSSSLHG
ncbi:MLO protein homolog 1-like isoform X2 [Salvia miltiorrhiza]|uniref:MLO protein homolog 1-like isoform X2 n=1 Tax=Salvia miltiorrhiza TaxID=226208 RepID=UPI0025AC9A42|nr:MLO protein homolog 1-like isoform X2 [Salvia miltiorrhiza]